MKWFFIYFIINNIFNPMVINLIIQENTSDFSDNEWVNYCFYVISIFLGVPIFLLLMGFAIIHELVTVKLPKLYYNYRNKQLEVDNDDLEKNLVKDIIEFKKEFLSERKK